jgi:16S rRNA (adenine(1408)-N(1))-methyltransferase
VIDLGTGDGRFVLATAAAEPQTLVIGIDASADAMAEASGRAARSSRRGGLTNALFVAAAAEALPTELAGIADLVAIGLPWGSLLRGALALDADVARGIAGLVAPGGRVEILVAPAARDRLSPAVDVTERLANGLADDWRQLGLELLDAVPATDADIAATRSTWARRLGLRADDPDRRAYRLRLRGLSADPR